MTTRELDVTAKELMAEVKARIETRHTIPPGTFTTKQFAKELDVSESTAKRMLAKEAELGFLTREEWFLPRGGTCHIWRRAEDDRE